ncbi:MAG TPA: Nif3-like dinuclear metal center hexameric protein [Chitinophagaceae bacterium]|nr:Nif3-like dinuclear metal center hexameric protein [Chitinophagaceae bacterium]
MDKLKNDRGRRKFIDNGFKMAGAAALANIPVVQFFVSPKKNYTVQDVINIILKEIPGAPFKDTVDTLKSGNADQNVTGIASTMFATVEVIKKAASINANFIIAHEPTFYNHTDDINWTENNHVVQQKQELLKKYGIAVWRFHDQWHAYRPDGITYGVLKKTNWLQYNKMAEKVFTIPVLSLKGIVDHLKKSLGISHVRVIGDLSANIKKIALLPGAWGGQNQVSTAEKETPDVLIVGEVHEWETAEYIRDTRSLGSRISLIVLGHSVSEEPGMEWLVDWLQPKLEGIGVTHIASNNPFSWV